MGEPFTKEQDEWLRKHHSPDKIIRDLTEQYNSAFGQSRSVDTMKHHCKRLGLEQERRNFTPEQNAWLTERQRKLSCKDMTALFNQQFKTNRSENVIKVHCNRELKIGFLNSHFQGGAPVGSEKVINGYVWVKVSNESHGKASFYSNWRQKSQVVWEQHYGRLPPKGYTIVFLDKNHKNTDIKNLYAVSGKVLREMSKKSWWSDNPGLTLAAIKWCELFYAIKGINKEVNNE